MLCRSLLYGYFNYFNISNGDYFNTSPIRTHKLREFNWYYFKTVDERERDRAPTFLTGIRWPQCTFRQWAESQIVFPVTSGAGCSDYSALTKMEGVGSSAERDWFCRFLLSKKAHLKYKPLQSYDECWYRSPLERSLYWEIVSRNRGIDRCRYECFVCRNNQLLLRWRDMIYSLSLKQSSPNNSAVVTTKSRLLLWWHTQICIGFGYYLRSTAVLKLIADGFYGLIDHITLLSYLPWSFLFAIPFSLLWKLLYSPRGVSKTPPLQLYLVRDNSSYFPLSFPGPGVHL